MVTAGERGEERGSEGVGSGKDIRCFRRNVIKKEVLEVRVAVFF